MANKFYISDCHFPICEWNAYYRNSYHLFGQIHGRLGDNCLIMRSRRNAYNAAVDNIVNMCEIKFYGEELSSKMAIHSTLITIYGLKYNEYSGTFTNIIDMDALFD